MEDLIASINTEMNKIINLDFDNIEEYEFFKQNIPCFFQTDLNIDCFISPNFPLYNAHLFLLCYQAFYKEKDFKKIKELIIAHKNELDDIIHNSTCIADYDNNALLGYLKNISRFNIKKLEDIFKTDWFELNIFVDAKKIEGTIFADEKYQETIKRVLLILFFKFDADTQIKNLFDLMNNQVVINSNYYNDLFSEEKIEKFKNNVYKVLFRKQNMDNIANTIETYYKHIISDFNKYVIKQNKTIDTYLYLQRFLQNFSSSKKELFELDFSLLQDINENIILELYKKGININSNYLQKLLIDKQELSKEELRIKKSKLLSNGYEINKISNSKLNFLLKYGNIETLIKNILFINKLEYKLFDIYSDNGLYILINTNTDILININNLLTKHIITQSLLEKYPQIFFQKDIINDIPGLYNLVLNNLNLLKNNYQINDFNINELLIFDSKLVSDNIKLLKSYSEILNINILKNNQLVDYVDLFIELGLSDYIDDNIDIIDQNSILTMKRIYIAKLLNLDVLKNEKINASLLTGNQFYVADSKLDDYIIDDTSNYIPDDVKNILKNKLRNNINIDNINLDLLDDNICDELTYQINDSFISRNKIIRNYNCLLDNMHLDSTDNLFYSMIYGSFLSKRQIEDIKNFIYNKNKKYIK